MCLLYDLSRSRLLARLVTSQSSSAVTTVCATTLGRLCSVILISYRLDEIEKKHYKEHWFQPIHINSDQTEHAFKWRSCGETKAVVFFFLHAWLSILFLSYDLVSMHFRSRKVKKILKVSEPAGAPWIGWWNRLDGHSERPRGQTERGLISVSQAGIARTETLPTPSQGTKQWKRASCL